MIRHFANEPQKIPDDFFEKFQFVSEIYVRNLKDGQKDKAKSENDLIEFVKKFKCIRSLKVYHGPLSDVFFKKLAKVQPNIWRFDDLNKDFFPEYDWSELVDHAVEFKRLYCLRTSSDVDDEFIEELSKLLGGRFCCSFLYNDSRIRVERKNNELPYSMYEGGNYEGDFNDLDDLMTKMYERFGD